MTTTKQEKMNFIKSPFSKLAVSTAADEVFLFAATDKGAKTPEDYERNVHSAVVGFVEELLDSVNAQCNNKLSFEEITDELDKFAHSCK